MPTIRHIDELLGSAWAWDDDDDEPEGRATDDEPGSTPDDCP